MDNSLKYYLRNSLNVAAGTLSSGAVFQTFLMIAGVSAAQIGTLTSVASVVQVIAMLGCSGMVDHLSDRRILSASAWLMLSGLLMPLTLLFINLGGSAITGETVFRIVLALTILCNLFTGVSGVLSYKLPYLLIPIRYYDRLCSMDSVFSGICSFLTSFAVTWLINHLVYSQAMTISFGAASLLVLLSVGVTFAFRPIPSQEATKKKQDQSSGFFDIFRLPSFQRLLLPNITRGLCTGVLAMLTVIGIHELSLDEKQAAMLAIVSVIASIGGGVVYRLLTVRVSNAGLCLGGSVLMLLSCMLMFPLHSYPVFLVFACLALIGQSIVNNAVPVLLTTFVPYSKIGQYTSYRMVLTTGASSLASFLTGFLLGPVSAVLLMTLAGLLQLHCGVAYFRFDRKARKTNDSFAGH